VNNNSTDNTEKIVKTFKNKLNLRIVFEKEKGRGFARRAGFAVAKGDVILSTDADTIVPKNWINEMTRLFQGNTIVAVTGPSRVTDRNAFMNTFFSTCQPIAMKLYRFFVGHYWLSGFNFAIRRDIYEKSGGFKEMDAQEDTDLSFRVSKLGKITYNPHWKVVVSGRRFQQGVLKGVYNYVDTYTKLFIFRKPVYLSNER
ncbi:MAG: glycosyltransferase, partial [Candidatus Levyibacteriota bacterium]